jgi:hypothetical protein
MLDDEVGFSVALTFSGRLNLSTPTITIEWFHGLSQSAKP